MCRQKTATLIGVMVLMVTSVQGSTPQELSDLARLQREVALVREFAEDLQAVHGRAKRLGFRYEDVLARLTRLESDIAEHIRYANQAPRWERFGD